MTTLTPRYAFPKPELTDLVTNGWDAVADLADAVDTNLGNVADQAAAASTAAAAASVALATIDAAGDLLVGTGPDAVARLAKGTAGQQLRISAGGVVAWEDTPATDLSSRVAKAGDTMTGRLQVTDLGVAVGTTLNLRQQGGATPAHLDAGNVLDNGARVYSPNNPPPAGGAVISQVIRGTIALGNTVTSATATVAVGTLAKAELRHHGVSHPTSGIGNESVMTRVALTNATTVTATRGGTTGAATVAFEITEWS